MKTSKDGRCQFDPKWNSFQLAESGKRLRSWSKLIKQFTVPVDSERLAINYAAKNNMQVADVLAMWAKKADESRARGTSIHAIFDAYAQTKHCPLPNTATEVVAVKFIKDFFETNRLVPVESELIAYNEEYDCATLIDCVVRDRSGLHYIIDWKTDAVIKNQNYGRYMLPPFNMLPDHPLMQHELQLNFCKQLCVDYQIKGMYIGHIADTGYRLLPVQDMELNLASFCTAPQVDLPF
ncbi:MAG: hypothetical protein V4560_14980 [Bacteroidota bacterium]